MGLYMKVTIKDVARAANVSVGTASMALNDKKGVNSKTRERVRRIANELSYVPNYSARSLVTQKSDCIGLIVPEIINPYYSSIVEIMTKLTEKMGLMLLLGISYNKSRLEEEYIKMFRHRNVLGVVIVPMLSENPDTSHLRLLRSAKIPFVFCTERYANCDEPGAMCDFDQGEYEMIRYLLQKGVRDICFLTLDFKTSFTTMRMKGLERAFEEKGVEVDRNNIFYLDSPAFSGAYEITDQILRRKPKAIVTINDIMAIGILKRLVELRIRVPEDVWVAGFDDVLFAELAAKPLTTVKQPLWDICGKCMELLTYKIDHPHEEYPVKGEMTCFPAELIIRDSTA